MNLWTRYLLTVTLACFVVLTGCTKSRARLNPLDPSSGITPTATPGPSTQTLWKNGTEGTFIGKGLEILTGPSFTVDSIVAVTDDVTSDPSTLRLTAGTSTNSPQMSMVNLPYGTVNISGYSAGHVRFNIRLEKSAASFIDLRVGAAYLNLASLSTSVFTHIDITVASFNWGAIAEDTPFSIVANLTSSMTGAILTVNDIRWTVD